MTIFKYDGIDIDSEKLTVDDMPTEIMREIFTYCGADTAMNLLCHMNGCTIQIPTNGMSKIERKIIVNHYNKSGCKTAAIREICRRFNISEGHVRNILRDAKQDVPCEGQLECNFAY